LIVFVYDDGRSSLRDIPNEREFFGDPHERNNIAKGCGKGDIFCFATAKSYACLKLAGPDDRTVVVGDDISGAREAGGASGVVGTEIACKVGVYKAFKAFGFVGSVNHSFVCVADEVAEDALESCLVYQLGLGTESSTLMDGVGKVGARCAC